MARDPRQDRSRSNNAESAETTIASSLPDRNRHRRRNGRTSDNADLPNLGDESQPRMNWYEAGRELQKRGLNVTINLANLDQPVNPSGASFDHIFTSNGPSSNYSVPEEALRALLPLRATIEFKAPQVLATSSTLPNADLPPVTCYLCEETFDNEQQRECHFARNQKYCALCKKDFDCEGLLRGSGHECAEYLNRGKARSVGRSAHASPENWVD
ncbi:uncharacterized protein HMPREF1541_03216 [Cyphellophora europaea CBS 101466]|uniref:Uncharacterized protein n=1 Tax=Cyphellophora europaea (strain CBS 101466) TaxID=1220924 RepID=W2RXN3_CYPE1|nr:uncharacterized protein HMPREF1541_03216 [Cyphellophora europaea CBS 101466]ETN41281.1 hypothetical protein HMPREF1541_03216 [Cyphellophora europaea CBS 101466]